MIRFCSVLVFCLCTVCLVPTVSAQRLQLGHVLHGTRSTQVIRDRNLYPLKNAVAIYLGTSVISTELKNATDFEISDWERYGLRSEDLGNTESRARVNLSGNEPPSQWVWFTLGMQFYMYEQFALQLEFEIAPIQPITGQSLSVGVAYDFLRFNRKHQVVLGGSPLMLGLAARGGYSSSNVNYTTRPVSDYDVQVDAPNAEFNVGTDMQLNYRNLFTKVGLKLTIRAFDQLAIMLEAGYQYQPLTSFRIVFPDGNKPEEEKDILWDNNMVVRTDGTSTKPTNEPLLGNRGPYISVNFAVCITEALTRYKTSR
jgi:hypothetical protein